MAKVLTEYEVAAIGANGASYTSNLCCTAGRASTLNCNVTEPKGASNNQLVTGVAKKGPVANGNYFWFTGSTVSDVSNTGGTSAVPTITECRWYTTYDNGGESYTSVSSSSVTWAYGKIAVGGSYSESNPPGYTAASYSSSSSNCQFSPGTNSSSRKLLGWAFIRGIYGGSTDYIRREVWQAGKSETGHSLSVYTDPLSSKIPGSGGTSEYLVVTVTYYTTYSDGTTSSSNVTSSSTIQYNTTSTDSQPSTWYSSSEYGRLTVGQNSYTYDVTVGYGWARATYNGYSATDRSTIKQEGYTPSGPTVTGHYLKTYTYSLSHISGSGGTSAVPSFYVRYYTTYSNGTEDYIDVTNQATIKYNKTTTDSEPSSWYTSSSYCQFTCGQSSSSKTETIGYAWVKAWYNGESKADRSTVKQDAYTGTGFIYHWDVSNAANKTTPVLQFFRSGDTVHDASAFSSGRNGGPDNAAGEYSASWYKTGTISQVAFIESGSEIKKVQINGYNGTTYLYKMSFSTYTLYQLDNSFSTSDYTNGTNRIYAYYYLS